MLKALTRNLRPPAATQAATPPAATERAAASTLRDILGAVGDFLAEHGLPPSPANYALAHAFVTGSDAALAADIAELTEGRLRITQAQADAIMNKSGGDQASVATPPALSAERLAVMVDTAHANIDRFSDIMGRSREDTRAFGEALVSNVDSLDASALEVAAITALLDVTRSMIGKTREAEERLTAAVAEMDDLRINLAAARQDAETDPLTGLPNRRAFDAHFHRCIARARPAGAEVCLALCDIDRFKLINDQHGHEIGDRVIKMIARELQTGCPGHMVGRHGGEEFVILFEGVDLDAATELLDGTRDTLSRRHFSVAGSGDRLGKLTFSGGIIRVGEREGWTEAMHRADVALYKAKETGRNRIERAD